MSSVDDDFGHFVAPMGFPLRPPGLSHVPAGNCAVNFSVSGILLPRLRGCSCTGAFPPNFTGICWKNFLRDCRTAGKAHMCQISDTFPVDGDLPMTVAGLRWGGARCPCPGPGGGEREKESRIGGECRRGSC